jgi:hypothetical protein
MKFFIGISGPAHSGKTTVSELLNPDHSIMLAKPIKEIVSSLTGYTIDELSHGNWREKVDPRFGISMRALMQKTATFYRELLGDDIFIRHAMEDVHRITMNNPNTTIIITDVREPEEQKAIIDVGGIIFILLRDEAGLEGGYANHKSENSWNSLLEIHPEYLDKYIFKIDNNGTLEQTQKQIQKVIKKDDNH